MNNNEPSQSDLAAPEMISLEDKYTLKQGRAFMTGTQAFVRLAMLQHQCDVKAGLTTAGYITGYRGSPLGAVDITAKKRKSIWRLNTLNFIPAWLYTGTQNGTRFTAGIPALLLRLIAEIDERKYVESSCHCQYSGRNSWIWSWEGEACGAGTRYAR